MRKLFLLVLTSAWIISAGAQALQDASAPINPLLEVSDERILSFEESAAPFVASKGSALQHSDLHYKHGAHAARWQWSRSGAQLRIGAPIGYLAHNPNSRETSVSTFVFWVYAAKPLDGSLRFEFRKQGRTCAWFDYGLSFTGWRGAWVAFDRDMQGHPEEGMDEVVITARDVKKGELFFDHLILSSFQDVRHHTADFQAPQINAATTSHWLVLLQSWRNPLPRAAAAVSEAERQDMATVESRLRELLIEGGKPTKISAIRKRFKAYNIIENSDGTLRGKPIWFVRYAETYINLGHTEVAQLFNDNDQTLRRYNDFMYQVAVTYNNITDAAERAELARMYVLLTRHLLDQGFAAGSAQGTLHHLGYSVRNFYTAPVLMRDVLRDAGLEGPVQQAMEWFSGVGEVKLPPVERGMDIDAFNTSLIGRLASIVLLPDSPDKAVWMECFSRWVDNGYKITEGTGPCFKSDGTVFHHRHHYPAYAVDGFSGGAVNAVWLLSRTQFAISFESHENLKRALLEMRFYCNLRSFPLALSGRHPDGRGALVPWHYARLAVAGSPDGGDSLDRELASAYLRLTEDKNSYTRRFAAEGIVPESSPTGFRAYGYNASASHRRDNWLLTVAGHSRYLWSAEIYQGANHYGRYLTHGSLQLLGDGDPVTSSGSGFRQQGWDWCHIPGTTAVEIPMTEMKADIRNVDTVSGYEEMLLSDEQFAGAASHQGAFGAYGLRLHEHDKYNGSLRARKSFFFFDNRVVALGSDIENAAEGGVHTTLFQNHLPDTIAPVWVGGEAVTAFPWRKVLPDGGVVKDNLGNAYFVPKGEVIVTRERQQSLDEETDAPTEGDFMKAYINHGGKIRGGGYEYLMVVHAGNDELSAYAQTRPYEVYAADRHVHAVRDRQSGVYAAVVFEPTTDRVPGSDAVEAVSQPCILLQSRDAEGVMTLSVADPDLRFYEGPSDELFDAAGRRLERSIYSRKWIDKPSGESRLWVTLAGRWQLAVPSDDVRVIETAERFGALCTTTAASEVTTRLEFSCREGATREVKLKEIQ